MRIALGLEYDGSAFHGWQRQPKVPTVQGHLEIALSRVANTELEVFVAGRTDRGVHAYNQVVHFDTEVTRSTEAWVRGVNTFLPPSIRVTWQRQVPDDFHARYSAASRSYVYLIKNNPVNSGVLNKKLSWFAWQLDETKMLKSAQYLLGEHDFSSFRASECQAKTATRNITEINILRRQDVVIFKFTANAFLHHMVRNIVGTLLEVGQGRKPIDWVKTVLESKDRRQAGVTAPPQGLYLSEVGYLDKYNLPVNQHPFLPFF